ncbi:hypothetical protein [Oleiharenicola lentus]|uniref:hypothetical protein n=1 Tax=Oleiharenicola lentus TaxID=2508720 RepID=UPI003F67A7B3
MSVLIPIAPRESRNLMLVWWVLWASQLAGLGALYAFLVPASRFTGSASPQSLINLIGVAPLFISIVIRWLMLPRVMTPVRAFSLVIVGLATAEACGILGIFLGGIYTRELVLLGVLGLLQYAPVFARQTFEPRTSGFRSRE